MTLKLFPKASLPKHDGEVACFYYVLKTDKITSLPCLSHLPHRAFLSELAKNVCSKM